MQTIDRLARARAGLILSAPFYATLSMGLELVEDNSQETAATDGEAIFYNREYVDGLSDPELRGLLAHEVMHVANNHHTRRGGRDPEDWNKAADYVINPALVAEGFTLPAGGLHRAEYEGMSTEQVYNALRSAKKQGDKGKPGQQGSGNGQGQQQPGQQGQQQPGSGQGQPSPDMGMGGVIDAAPAHDKAALKAAELATQAKVIQAASVAKAAGQASAAGQRLADAARKPEIDWRAILRRYVDESARKDYSWSRPNRRHIHAGMYLPGTVPDGLARLTIVIDTSGSIDTRALNAFTGELQGAVDDAAPDAVDVIHCDRRVHAVETFGPGEPLAINPIGGGGTDMQPALDIAARDSSAVIVFTDCEFSARRALKDPGLPVLWARWGGGGTVPDFGELIDI